MKYLDLLHIRMHPLTDPTPGGSKEQLLAIKANDEKTLKALYQENFKKVEHFIVTNNGTQEEAKDIYQEAFIAVWRNIQMDRFKPESPGALGGYLFQVARNKWIDQLRGKKLRQTVPLQEEITQYHSEPFSKEESDHIILIKQHFGKLGEQCQELLRRFYFNKDSMRVIAEYFSWTEASAKNNKYRCLQRLRAMIQQKTNNPQ